jgi:glycine betaine/choline ABC-type transport system substrate-binding protein
MDRRQIVACLIAGPTLTACRRRGQIRPGSKNFTEQVILGEIVAQHLEHRLRTEVNRKLNLGGTLLAHQAITTGAIDVYPEYTGTALTAVLQLAPVADAGAAFAQVRQEYRRRFRLAWLPPLGFDNSFAMVIRADQARRDGLATLSDAARYPRGWKLGIGYEFLDRPDGLPALKRTYGLKLDGPPTTMDLGLLYRALEQGNVTMVAGSATDGLLSVLDVTVLRDDSRAFPPYQAALVVREEALSSNPKLRDALMELSGKLTERTMQSLNYAVDGKHEAAAEVARSFRLAAGLAAP